MRAPLGRPTEKLLPNCSLHLPVYNAIAADNDPVLAGIGD